MAEYDSLPDSHNIEDFTGRVWWADALDLLRALPDKSVDMALTDFPYQITEAHYDQHELDFVAIGAEMFRVIRPDGAVISTAAQPFTSKLVMLWEKYFRYEWIWRKTRKTNFLNAKKMPLAAHESILVFGHKLPRYYPQMVEGEAHLTNLPGGLSDLYGSFKRDTKVSNLYYPDTVILANPDNSIFSKAWNHPNQKPVALWEYLIKTYTQTGDIILDPFAGSATTAIACLNLDRRYICGDSHLPYVEMSRKRIQNHDPFKASILSNGQKQLSLFENMGSETDGTKQE